MQAIHRVGCCSLRLAGGYLLKQRGILPHHVAQGLLLSLQRAKVWCNCNSCHASLTSWISTKPSCRHMRRQLQAVLAQPRWWEITSMKHANLLHLRRDTWRRRRELRWYNSAAASCRASIWQAGLGLRKADHFQSSFNSVVRQAAHRGLQLLRLNLLLVLGLDLLELGFQSLHLLLLLHPCTVEPRCIGIVWASALLCRSVMFSGAPAPRVSAPAPSIAGTSHPTFRTSRPSQKPTLVA